MDASPAPSSSSPVPRPPTRTLIINDCDPEDLGRAVAPIGPPAELALRRPSPYATMCARAPTKASTAAADGDRAADLSMGRFEPPPLRFDPLLPIDPRRLAEINAGAPGGSRETMTVVHSSQRRRVELSRFAPYPLPSSGVRIEPMAPLPLPAVAPTPAPSPASATPPPGRQQVFPPPPPPRGKFSCPHGLNPRLTRVFLGRLVLDGFPSPFYIPMASILID
jgi:hypothetical protein